MMADDRPPCFVMMPFHEKVDRDGNVIDFDRIYRDLIVEAVHGLPFKVVRCDEILRAGTVLKDMFGYIANSELAIVDVTLGNPNVMYELGVRHALRPATTILLNREGDRLPFNIAVERVIEYPRDLRDFSRARETIRSFITEGIRKGRPDSPIFDYVKRAQQAESAPVRRRADYRFRLVNRPDREIWVVTGNIRDLPTIDVWVNSENTNMQMARYFDRSVSGTIRYEGARKDPNREVVEDTINTELREAVNGREMVAPGAVYVTGPGALAERGVRRIFHVAAVHGTPGAGYQAIGEVERCVSTALERMDGFADDDLRTIVFPLFGTGTAGEPVDIVGPKLMDAAIVYLGSRPDTRVTRVYFIAWNQHDLDVCLNALEASPDLERMP